MLRYGRFFARSAWLALTALLLALFVVSLPLFYAQVVTFSIENAGSDAPLDAVRLGLEQLGLPAAFYAGYLLTLVVIFALVYLVVGLLIFWRKGHDRLTFLISLWLVSFGVTFPPPVNAVANAAPAWGQVIEGLSLLSFLVFFLLFYLFPDGRFVPSWTRWFAALFVARVAGEELFADTLRPYVSLPPLEGYLELFVWGGSMVYAQWHRYRRVSSPLQRQQTKWVVLGLAVALGGFIGVELLGQLPGVQQPGAPALVYDLVFVTTLTAAFLLIPLSIGFAVLRYRLWDVDLLIRRTLIYGALTLGLALVYFGSVVLLQNLLRTGVGQAQNQLVTVLSTLSIAALFTPLRHRLQERIDRRFYRRKYNAEQVLAAFGETAAHETDLEQMAARLLAAVQESMQPVHASLWLRNAQHEGST